MPKVMIVDPSKISMVMTSDLLRDHIPGLQVEVCSSGREALQRCKEIAPDLCVIDFDLPDADGPSLVEALRLRFGGPMFLTAFPYSFVSTAVEENLFAYLDSSAWLAKPLCPKAVQALVAKFISDGHHVTKRWSLKLPVTLIARAEGRGKRAPKAQGALVNLSATGACVQSSGCGKFSKHDLVKIRTQGQAGESVLEATVVWRRSGAMGVQFQKRCILGNEQLKSLVG